MAGQESRDWSVPCTVQLRRTVMHHRVAGLLLLVILAQSGTTAGWQNCSGSGYEYKYIAGVSKTFNDTVSYCRTLSTNSGIATPRNAIQNQCILNSRPSATTIWIGIRSFTYPFQWITVGDGFSLTYTNWHSGQPDGIIQECATMWYLYPPPYPADKWDNFECNKSSNIICEQDLNECVREVHSCSSRTECVNTIGSYRCMAVATTLPNITNTSTVVYSTSLVLATSPTTTPTT
eukprot:scpid96463/ scgid13921/ Collectin-12; Collectin placenta protein 1; Nurse cell scavenger receptor 2; Scavenger receptor class A member 4; Scavenger receptor with C-type lectin